MGQVSCLNMRFLFVCCALFNGGCVCVCVVVGWNKGSWHHLELLLEYADLSSVDLSHGAALHDPLRQPDLIQVP